MLRYQELKDKAYRVLDVTTLTVDEFEQLVIPVNAAFVAHMQDWTMEGKPRTERTYSHYANCPLPTPEDRLLFILIYLNVAALQVAHGALFGMSQPNANKWIHVLLPVLEHVLAVQGDAPARHIQAISARLDALRDAEPVAAGAAPPATSPFFCTLARNAQSHVPRTMINKARVIAARKSAIQ